MMKAVSSIIGAFAVLSTSPAVAFAPSCPSSKSLSQLSAEHTEQTTRGDFLSTSAIAAITTVLVNPIQPAYARGRATLEPAYEKYTPRIIAGGKFYSTKLYAAVSKNDFVSIKQMTAEPPKKTKADRVLADGGISERAAKAGGFSDSR